LGTALRLDGYSVEVRDLSSTGTELQPITRVRRILARTAAYPRLYKAGKRLEGRMLSMIPESARAQAFVVLALARPGQPPGR
jgi:predicted alpha/beta-hydrolase family hydrolase